jgi:hypothetical protein
LSAGPLRDLGLQPERTSLAWRRTLLALVVVDLLVWRSWALAGPRAAAPGAGTGAPDYLGICALTAMAATVVLCLCVLARGRELRRSFAAPPAALMRWAAAAVVVLAGSAVAAVALGR